MKDILCKGNVIINKIKVGDIHWEFEMGMSLKVKVTQAPERSDSGEWSWVAECVKTGRVIHYMQHEDSPHYDLNLYDYEAYGKIPRHLPKRE